MTFLEKVKKQICDVQGDLEPADIAELDHLISKAETYEGTISDEDLQCLVGGLGPDDPDDVKNKELREKYPLLDVLASYPYLGLHQTQEEFIRAYRKRRMLSRR